MAMFQCYFEENPKSEVIEVLGKYQKRGRQLDSELEMGRPRDMARG
ncbi:MAG: hypothetical protein K2H90_00770 [Oscillospiraceae bacterium]|nr:hypothetical protein [Oscillospiraceae bacterium]